VVTGGLSISAAYETELNTIKTQAEAAKKPVEVEKSASQASQTACNTSRR
jgi:hypothetical protein